MKINKLISCVKIISLMIYFIIVLPCSLLSQATQSEITITGTNQNQQFGWASAHNQDYTIITAPRDSIFGHSSGSAYLFKHENNQWVLDKKITEPNGSSYNYFGQAIDLDGNTVAISSYQSTVGGIDAGAVFIYEFINNELVLKQTLIPEGDVNFFKFGTSIDVFGNQLIIGAPGADNGKGRAFVYQKIGTEWQLEKVLKPVLHSKIYNFGNIVALNDNFAVVCSKSNVLDSMLSAYFEIFSKKSGWGPMMTTIKSQNDLYNRLGTSIAMNNSFLVLGNPFSTSNDGIQRYSGNVQIYKFQKDSLVADTILYNDAGLAKDMFGQSITLHGNTLAISAPGNDVSLKNSGLTCLYEYNGKWIKTMSIKPNDPTLGKNAYIGYSMSMDDHSLITSTPMTHSRGDFSGKAYYYQISQVPSMKNDNIQVSVTPNPADISCTVSIHLAKTYSSLSMYLYNLAGKQLSEDLYGGKLASGSITKEIDLQSYRPGILFLKINADNDEAMIKIIIQR